MRGHIQEEVNREFKLCIRNFMLRMQMLNKNNSDELQQTFVRILNNNDIKQSIINHLINTEIKGDSHQIVMLALLKDLCKWCSEYHQYLRNHPGPMESILNQSIALLNSQQQYHNLVPKQHQLICSLLTMPYCCENIEQYKLLYRKLKDIKDFYSSTIKESQKSMFAKCIEESIEVATRIQCVQVLQFITSNILEQFDVLQLGNELIPSRLKLLKKVTKALWVFEQEILIRIAYIIIKISKNSLDHPHLISFVFGLYEELLNRFMEKDSIVPLIMYTHLILNNLVNLQRKGGQFLKLQILLSQVSKIFQSRYLNYFLRIYDWNFMEEDVCHQSLKLLYEYIEDSMNQKKPEIQIYKKHLNLIHQHIRKFLQNQSKERDHKKSQQQQQFYKLKKKQYSEYISEMNSKPKSIFKKIENCESEEVREHYIQKYIRVLKKSKHIEYTSMINIVSTDNKISALLLQQYALTFIKRSKYISLQQFIRLFTANFFLTGQSQQIARVMDKITQYYYAQQDPSNKILKTSDDVYVFANAIIILNTDQHNPKHQNKMSEETFLKMCQELKLPAQIVKKTYRNIKHNEIYTFRNRFNMHNISLANWILLATQYQLLPLSYFDQQMEHINNECFYSYADDLLSSIIDEKETAKLQTLIERFEYHDKKFECDVIEISRKMLNNKPHIPMHALQKTYEIANFKSNKITDKTLSYCWLAANIIENFKSNLPASKVCEFLIITWNLRNQLMDNLSLREAAELKKIKKCIKESKKRQSKKSLLNMFSSFLSSKDSDDNEPQYKPQPQTKINYTNLGQNIFEIIQESEEWRVRAAEYIILYVHNQQAKLFQEFISCLYLIFNLVKGCQNEEIVRVGLNFFEEMLQIRTNQFTKRIHSIKTKDIKKYEIMEFYSSYWILKLMMGSQTNERNQRLIQQCCLNVQKCNKEIAIEFIEIAKDKKTSDKLKEKLVYLIERNQIAQDIQVKSFYQQNKKEASMKKQISNKQQTQQVPKEKKEQVEIQGQVEKKGQQEGVEGVERNLEKEIEEILQKTDIKQEGKMEQQRSQIKQQRKQQDREQQNNHKTQDNNQNQDKQKIQEKQAPISEIPIQREKEEGENVKKDEKEEGQEVSLPIYML